MKEHKIKYAKSLAIKNFNKINNQLNERFKLTTFGDGKYQIIEGILKQTVEIPKI